MKRASLLVLVLALAGCSQVAAIAPVGGSHEAEVRFAAGDVLVAKGVDILVGPDCATVDGVVGCTGETVDGESIVVTSDATTLTVTVGSDTLYSGNIIDALDDAIRPGS